MNNPKISVIVPVYNVEKYLPECLDSIINQTLRDIEIICLNDGSTDNSLSILKEYASKDERIILIDKKNDGLGYTRKVGLDIAKGKYILFCDSDDYYYGTTAFEELYNYIEDKKVDVVIFENFRYKSINRGKNIGFYEDETDYFNSPQKEIFTYLDIDLDYMLKIDKTNRLSFRAYMWKKIYSKEFFDKYNDWYFPKYIMVQDLPLHFQILMRARMAYIKKNIYVYRYRAKSAARNRTDKKLCNFCQVYKDSYGFLKEKFPNVDLSSLVYYSCFKLWLFDDYQIKSIDTVKTLIDSIKTIITSEILFNIKDKQEFFFFRAAFRMSPENYWDYLNKKNLKLKKNEIVRLKLDRQIRDNLIEALNEQIKNRDSAIKQKNNEIQNLSNQNKNLCEQNNIQDQAIKRLQNSWSYRIGRAVTYPLSIPLDFYRFICDYNLIKKSGLFDSEYYLSQNEDVKKAKADPLKHYLKFGWKEGRNPSAKFDGNEYLNKRPDLQAAGLCPLVHYVKFGKDKK